MITQFMYPNLPYDGSKDFTGVALVASSPLMVTVHSSVPATTVVELAALAKSKPGVITYGSTGNGSVPHLATELLRAKTGAPLTHVPYKGGGPAATDLVAGHIAMMMASPIEVSQHVAAGRLRYLVASSHERGRSVPGVPAVQEAGIPSFDDVAWFGIVTRSGTHGNGALRGAPRKRVSPYASARVISFSSSSISNGFEAVCASRLGERKTQLVADSHGLVRVEG